MVRLCIMILLLYTKHVYVDIYALNLFIEHSGEHWWEQNIFCSFSTPQAFWQSSAPGALSTLVTSVVLYSLTRATLISLGKDETRVCGYIHIYIGIYIHDIHHWKILWISYGKLPWVVFERTTTDFRSDALARWPIRPWVQLALRANFVQLL